MRSFVLLFVSALISVACSSESSENKDPLFNEDGIALGGYDPVAYFEQSEAKQGTKQESIEYKGLTYYFSSTKNRALFRENPDKYLPQYGGWCAYAVAETSTKMEPNPEEWQIQDGELILFTSSFMTKLTGSLKDEWNEDPESYESKADANWSNMKK